MKMGEEEEGFMVEAGLKKKKKGTASRNWIARNWIVLGASGQQGIILDLDKFDIMNRLPINARDLRILDPFLSYPSAILARDKAIVLNLEVNYYLFIIHSSLFLPPLSSVVFC